MCLHEVKEARGGRATEYVWKWTYFPVYVLSKNAKTTCLLLLFDSLRLILYLQCIVCINVSLSWSRINERTISLRFLGIILRVVRLEVPYTMFTLHASFSPLLLKGWGEKKPFSRGDCEQQEEDSVFPITSKIRPHSYYRLKQIFLVWRGGGGGG